MRLECLPAIFSGMLLSLLSIHAAFARGQSTATLTGKITDPSDAVITGAKIAAQPLDSAGKPATTQSGREGNFSLALAPGRYRVSIAYPSFERTEQEFTLAAGETRTWEVRLILETLSSNVIVTAQAEPELAGSVVAPVDVITREELDDRQEIFLTPNLASVPGASFSQLGPEGGITSFFLDGGNSEYAKVLVDGVPVNEPGGAVDFSNFTNDDIDKIEVVHGAASALYGSDAMDGVVQIFTHRGNTPTPELVLEGDGGTFDTGDGSGQLSGLLGLFDYSVGAAYFDAGGQGPGDYFRDTTLSGNFGWKFSDTDTLRLTLRNSASDAGQPGQTLFPDVPFAVNIGQHSNLQDFSSGLVWNFTVGQHWQNQLNVYESRFQDIVTFAPGPGGSITDNFNRAGLDGQSTYLFHNGGITLGYVNEDETGDAHHRHNQAGYGEVRYRFTRRLVVVAGGRAEDNASFGISVAPRIGASYALRYGQGFWGATRLRASYGLGIKEPDFIDSFSADPCFRGNPNLKPERSATVDAGIEQMLASDRVRISITYFHNDFYDIVSFQPITPPPGCLFGAGMFFNTDKARAYGTNSTIEMKAAKWLSFRANYSYDDTLVLSSPNATDPTLVPGNRLLKRPLNSGNASLNAHWRGVDWNLFGTYVGTRTDSDFLGLGITRDPGYFRLDMTASVPLRHGLSATAFFGNLLDRHYQDAVGYPALGYNYRVGLKYVWGGERGLSF
ncbi:MAG: TonB-dependent receptor domain-containing protein [Candidatus Acidiferrales bacterium]